MPLLDAHGGDILSMVGSPQPECSIQEILRTLHVAAPPTARTSVGRLTVRKLE